MPKQLVFECEIKEFRKDDMLVEMYDRDKIRTCVNSFGDSDFVPFLNANLLKVKYGDYAKLAKQMCYKPQEILEQYLNNICRFRVTVRQNKFGDSTSISIILNSVEAVRPMLTEASKNDEAPKEIIYMTRG